MNYYHQYALLCPFPLCEWYKITVCLQDGLSTGVTEVSVQLLITICVYPRGGQLLMRGVKAALQLSGVEARLLAV